jgi:hypothetical protein
MLQQTGHANEASPSFNVSFRVSRLLSVSFGTLGRFLAILADPLQSGGAKSEYRCGYRIEWTLDVEERFA